MNEFLKSIYNKILELDKRIRDKEARDEEFKKKILEYFESEEYKKIKQIQKQINENFKRN
jgi:hypothetical protein